MARKKETGTIRRQQIIEAARKLIASRGSEYVTIKGIAGEVGISEAAIYRHFNHKRDVFCLLIDSIGDKLVTEVRETENQQEVNKKLYFVLQKHISEIEQQRGIAFQVIVEVISLGDKGLNSKTFDILHKYINELKILLDDGVEKREFRQDLDTQSAATLLFSMIQGLVNLWYLSEYDFNLKSNYETLWKTFCKVISPNGDDTFIISPLVEFSPM